MRVKSIDKTVYSITISISIRQMAAVQHDISLDCSTGKLIFDFKILLLLTPRPTWHVDVDRLWPTPLPPYINPSLFYSTLKTFDVSRKISPLHSSLTKECIQGVFRLPSAHHFSSAYFTASRDILVSISCNILQPVQWTKFVDYDCRLSIKTNHHQCRGTRLA